MPLVSIILQKKIELQMDALKMLKDKCDKVSVLRFRRLYKSYIFTVHDLKLEYPKQPCEVSIAVAEYRRNIFAIYPVRGISGEKYVIFDYFVRNKLKNGDTVIVFSKKSYDAIMKYSKGINLSVILA